MNPMLRKMKYGILFKTLLLGLAVGCSACRQPDGEPTGERRIRFELTLDARTRAPQALDTEQYAARLYLFREETADRYVAAGTMEITGEALTVGGLDPGVSYRFVFLAIPRSQQPALPMLADGTAYTEAAMTYLAGNQPCQEVFRAIQTFTAADDPATRSVVLTRQNGAIQIRLGNADGSVRNARLEVEALPEMLLQDGTGGQVLSQGAAVALAKSEQPAVTSDYRIAVNLLPAEDITGQGPWCSRWPTARSSVTRCVPPPERSRSIPIRSPGLCCGEPARAAVSKWASAATSISTTMRGTVTFDNRR